MSSRTRFIESGVRPAGGDIRPMRQHSFPRHGFSAHEIFGPSPLKDALQDLHALLEGKSPEERIEIARQQLRSNHPETLLAVIKTARITGSQAAPLVPDLLALLTCELIVPYTSIRENGVDNASIAGEATFAIRQIGAPPDCAALRRLLTNPHRFYVPMTLSRLCFDAGDPMRRTIMPAALAADLLPLLGDEAFELASFVVHLIPDPDPDVAHMVWQAITLLAERARDYPTPAATPMIEALRGLRFDFAGPLWVAVRPILGASTKPPAT